MSKAHEFGRLCEDLAANHLAARGWRILSRGFRLGHKEIDIVARRGRLVAFIEVKGRSTACFGHPLLAITPAKRREIARVASCWIVRHGRPSDVYRFDAIAITRTADRLVLEHVPDAWRVA